MVTFAHPQLSPAVCSILKIPLLQEVVQEQLDPGTTLETLDSLQVKRHYADAADHMATEFSRIHDHMGMYGAFISCEQCRMHVGHAAIITTGMHYCSMPYMHATFLTGMQHLVPDVKHADIATCGQSAY